MEVRAVRILKKDGTSFIKVLVDSEQSPISIIRNEQWLEHNGKKYRYGFTFSEEFFEKIRKVEVEEAKPRKRELTTVISKEELKQMIKEALKEIEKEKQGE